LFGFRVDAQTAEQLAHAVLAGFRAVDIKKDGKGTAPFLHAIADSLLIIICFHI
jgi:hypothetical protein